MKNLFLRHLILAPVCVAALALCGGCRSYVDVNGRSCAMLTEREVRELVILARATMAKNSPRHATAAEVEEIRSTEPEIKINYYGNCLGEAVISWELKTRKIEIVYDGQLNSTDPNERDMILRVMEKQPPVLDFRPGRPRPKVRPPQQPEPSRRQTRPSRRKP